MQMEIKQLGPLFAKNDIEIDLPKVNEILTEQELFEIINKYDGVICGDDQFTKKVIDQAKNLKVIVKWGTGIDSIDSTYARKKGIPVCNTPNAFTDPVADTVLGSILDFARRISGQSNEVRQGQWKKGNNAALFEKTLGIIGVGNIGRAVAKRADACGMRILGNDIKKIPENVAKKLNIQMVSKAKIYEQSDFISLNCTLNKTSHHLITREELQAMENSAILINTARGPIIKEVDLIWALKNKQIAGAALDVFEDEPLTKNSPLTKMLNVILSAHNANNSPACWQRVHENSINQLVRELNQKK